MKTIYLSGPITGREKWEVKQHFSDASIMLRRQAARLTDEAVEIYDPSKISDIDFEWDTYMKVASAILHDPKVKGICFLKGWEKSNGCLMEMMWANSLGLKIIYEPGAMRA